MKILVTGATGFIGHELVNHLAQQGHEARVLVRNVSKAKTLPAEVLTWSDSESADASQEMIQALRGMDAVVHLAGHPIADSRWTDTIKTRILESRIFSTRQIAASLRLMPKDERPKTLICGSAIGFYGDRGDEWLTEASSSGSGFLAEVVRQWEAEAAQAAELGLRVVQLRTGVVLGQGGGALLKMKPVVLGSGKQWVSWIHLSDIVGLIRFALESDQLSGPLNAVSLEPCTQKIFAEKQASAIGTRVWIGVPRFALKLALGEMSQVVLESTRVLAKQAIKAGYQFQYPTLDRAFLEIYGPQDQTISL